MLRFGSEYRPDIDGLRALAVLSVILFHVDGNLLPGGFVGVDIFFVISGYLISRNILSELERGRFSITEFYRRRIKRIAPPMLVVVAVTFVAAQVIMLPENAEATAESAVWALASFANVHYWLHSDNGYFAAAASDTPLLHLWSLGVEEQFYFIWPVLLMLWHRFWRGRIGALVGIAIAIGIASFTYAQLVFHTDPSFAYYMLPTRAGELLLGALVAIGTLNGVERRIPAGFALPMAILGVVLIGGSLWFIDASDVFPGVLALPPTIGASLLILAGHCGHNAVSRAFAVKPIVWIGLVSYSAYLWHWPLLAFIEYCNVPMSPIVGAGAVVATFVLAQLTYRFVEGPARRSEAPALRLFARQFLAPAFVIGACALVAMKLDGYTLRSGEYRAQLAQLREKNQAAFSASYVCQVQRMTEELAHDPRCVLGADKSQHEVLLWGDSTAAQYVGFVGALAESEGFSFRNIEVGACPPILSDAGPYAEARRLDDCRKSAAIVQATIDQYQVILVSGYWTDYLSRGESFLDEQIATLTALADAGKRVVVIGQIPLMRGFDRHCAEKAIVYHGIDCMRGTPAIPEVVAAANAKLREFADGDPRVDYYDVNDFLCDDEGCHAFDSQGNQLYYDRAHLTLEASWAIGRMAVGQHGLPDFLHFKHSEAG